jgi:flagellar biosynthesis/type III secretory pathway M-ring protein FliF/YscJ
MALLFRVLLIALLIYLVVKLVRETMAGPEEEDQKVRSSDKARKVSKDVGEYVDFEEINEGERRKAKDERRTSEKTDRVSDKERGTRDFR